MELYLSLHNLWKGNIVENQKLITEIKKLRQDNDILRSLVNEYKYCSMTNLKGRYDFDIRFNELWFDYKNFNKDFVLCIVDLNGLHAINRSEGGWEAGDKIIKKIASELQNELACSDIYRTSGDEFFILNQNTTSKKLRKKLSNISSSEYGMACTIKDKPKDAELMFKIADAILVQKKNEREESR